MFVAGSTLVTTPRAGSQHHCYEKLKPVVLGWRLLRSAVFLFESGCSAVDTMTLVNARWDQNVMRGMAHVHLCIFLESNVKRSFHSA